MAIKNIAPGKAAGPDGLPGDLLLHDPTLWANFILLLMNLLAQGHPVPESWKGAEVVTIYKKGAKEDPANYRPISLIDVIQKVVGRVLISRMVSWLEEGNILTHLQAGFRQKVGTMDQVFRFSATYWKTVSIGKGSLYLAFIDLKTAFDLVPRAKLWQVLQDMGLPRYLFELIKRLHEGTYARIRWGSQGELTKRIPVNRGVRQG